MGDEVFVGRVNAQDYPGFYLNYLPAMIHIRTKQANFSIGENVYKDTRFQFCCIQNPKWVLKGVPKVLYGAIVGGCNKTGENYYIGRVLLNKSYYVGTVDPRIGCLSIVSGDGVISFEDYEVLCADVF